MKTIGRQQTEAREYMRECSLLVSVQSPYFQRTPSGNMRKKATSRDTRLFLTTMKMIIERALNTGENGDFEANIISCFYETTGTIIENNAYITFPLTGIVDKQTYAAAAKQAVLDYATLHSYSISESDMIWIFSPDSQESLPERSETTISLSVQTSTGAVGTQVSTTRDALVFVSENVETTSTIGGSSASDLVVEVAPTNSATAGDWIEKARGGQSQAVSLALALQSVQNVKGVLPVYVPKGYYIKVRRVGASGTTSDGISLSRVLYL